MITMKDIAERAGVSRPTVSAVLNRKETRIRVSSETRDRVLAIASELGYLPDENARATKTGYTKLIGVIGKFHGSYATEMLRGIAREIDIAGYSIKLVMPENQDELKRALRQCIEQRIRGIISYSSDSESVKSLEEISKKYSIPVVLIDSNNEFNWCSQITSDDQTGAALAVSHLLANGHRNAAFVTRAQHCNYDYSLRRKSGFRQAFLKAGIPVPESHFLSLTSASHSDDLIISDLIKIIRGDSISALFCSSDTVAMLLMSRLTEAGFQIPRDLSMMGFGNLEYAPYANPPLSTVAQPFLLMGSESVKQMMRQIENPKDLRKISLPIVLIERKSVQNIKQKELK